MSNQTLAVLTLLETAYRMDLDDAPWMRSVVRDAHAVLGGGLGAAGYFVDASSPEMFSTWGVECTGMDEAVVRKRFNLWSELSPITLKRHVHLHWPAGYASQVPPSNIAREALEHS